MNGETLTVSGRVCHIYGNDGADACIICGMDRHNPDEIADTARMLYESDEAAGCRLVVFETTDWNGDFSPWPSAPAFGNELFTGKAPETLGWIRDCLLPYLKKENILHGKIYIAGYSLSGLFALWSFMESGLFDGAAGCSGSLWLPGWMEYLKNHPRGRVGIVYLSLGSREEKTKNALMSAVGDNTRASYELLKNSPQITQAALEWNQGGHFSDPARRLAKGMLWLLKHGNRAGA